MKYLAVIVLLGVLSGCNDCCDRDCPERKSHAGGAAAEVGNQDCPKCRKANVNAEIVPIPAIKKLPEPSAGPK